MIKFRRVPIITVIFFLSFCALAMAQGSTIIMQIENPLANINGKEVSMDVAPMIVNNRTMVPLRFVAENFGLQVDWNDHSRKITISSDDLNQEQVGEKIIFDNQIRIDVSQIPVSSGWFIPTSKKYIKITIVCDGKNEKSEMEYYIKDASSHEQIAKGGYPAKELKAPYLWTREITFERTSEKINLNVIAKELNSLQIIAIESALPFEKEGN